MPSTASSRLYRRLSIRAKSGVPRSCCVEQSHIFRTLELLTPSFWLRRFHIRLTGEPSLLPPQVARVHLWERLPLPPIQRIDGERPDIVPDVVIDTEHAVWTLIAESARNDLTDSHSMAAVVDAGAWFAGARQHFVGVLECSAVKTSLGSVRCCGTDILGRATRPAAFCDERSCNTVTRPMGRHSMVGADRVAAGLLRCCQSPARRACARPECCRVADTRRGWSRCRRPASLGDFRLRNALSA